MAVFLLWVFRLSLIHQTSMEDGVLCEGLLSTWDIESRCSNDGEVASCEGDGRRLNLKQYCHL